MINDANPKNVLQGKAFDLASQALLAEYSAIREASLSRDQILSSLENFMLVVLSAVLASLPTIISQQFFIVLPVTSIIVSSIALAHYSQGRISHELAIYEEEVLRKNLIELLYQIKETDIVFNNTTHLWQWQSYIRKRTLKGSAIQKIARRLSGFGLKPLFLITSTGLIILFVYYRNTNNLELPELMSFWIAVMYNVLLILVGSFFSISHLYYILNKNE